MILYHGTSAESLLSIEEEGLQAPSYWTNDFDAAKGYADSFGKGVVISCDSNRYSFEANMLVAQCLLDSGEIDALPDEKDLEYSLQFLEGVVCKEEVVFEWEIAEALVKK